MTLYTVCNLCDSGQGVFNGGMNYILTNTQKHIFCILVSFLFLSAIAHAEESDLAAVYVGAAAELEAQEVTVDFDASAEGNDTDTDCSSEAECDATLINVCTSDAKICRDGSAVGRSGPTCTFAACPEEATPHKATVDEDSDAYGDSLERRLDTDDDGDSLGAGDVSVRSKVQVPSEIRLVGSTIRHAVAQGVEVRGWDPETKEVRMQVTALQTQDDLEEYAAALLVSNEALRTFVVAEHGATVHAGQQVKLFGFYPVVMNQEIEVATDENADDRVVVRSPWWSFLALNSLSESEIQVAIVHELALQSELSAASVPEAARPFWMLGAILQATNTVLQRGYTKVSL